MKQKSKIEFDFILLAAGSGQRMGFAKQFATINNTPIWKIALNHIKDHPSCAQIIVVFPNSTEIDHSFFDMNSNINWIYGGKTRSHSVWNALKYLRDNPNNSSYIAIHDAARPIIPHIVIDRIVEKTSTGEKAVIPTLPASDTVKIFSGNHISHTLDRNQLVMIQTPQIFEARVITESYGKYFDSDTQDIILEQSFPSDDASLVEANGIAVAIIEGSPDLKKLTIKEDFDNLEQRLNAGFETRTANGYDVHKFRDWQQQETCREIKICGVSLKHEAGLDAHSDGDVGLHALCDAIFGCLADGDIGSHFPPSEERWRNADSEIFLKYAINKVSDAGGKIKLLDVTIICELPKITPVRKQMRQRISEICALPLRRVSIKATTSEKLGFMGRKEGLAAIAAATISLPIIPE